MWLKHPRANTHISVVAAMPGGDPYGRAVCDDCRATTKKSDHTGIQSLRDAGAWCPKKTGGEVILCPMCVVKEVGEDDVYQRWNGRTSLRLTPVVAREKFDEHWNPAPGEAALAAPGEAALATPPGLGLPASAHATRVEMLEARVQHLEKEVEELKTLVDKDLVTLLKEMAAKEIVTLVNKKKEGHAKTGGDAKTQDATMTEHDEELLRFMIEPDAYVLALLE